MYNNGKLDTNITQKLVPITNGKLDKAIWLYALNIATPSFFTSCEEESNNTIHERSHKSTIKEVSAHGISIVYFFLSKRGSPLQFPLREAKSEPQAPVLRGPRPPTILLL